MENRSLGKSKEDYLEAILMLNQKKGWCREIDIAAQLGFSKPSVSIALRKLEETGYIDKLDSGEIRLTEAGADVASRTLAKHEFYTALFETCGIDKDIAEEEACQIEHAISEDSFHKMKAFFASKGIVCEA